mgnify:CR=1 FL=1
MGFWKTLGNIGSSLIGLGPTIGAAAQAKQSRRNVQAQIKADRELAEYQYSKDLEMWDRQNEYNSPSAHMQRLRDAGLNPNLVAGQAGSVGQATQMPKYQSIKTDFSKRQTPLAALGMLGQFQDYQMKQQQIGVLEATRLQKEMYNTWLQTKGLEQSYNTMNGKMKAVYRKNFMQLFDSQLNIAKQNIKRIERMNSRMDIGIDIDSIKRDFERWNQSFGLAGKGFNMLRTLFGK